ncbi:unnamed protein product [Brassica rapa]|uniref:Uncharacterized protein n=1 Tax=Brassica campestris TaxID=3711 RepID=A0A8D9HKY5_BRACM|nr:unnamed protein product [Brassica rapa]
MTVLIDPLARLQKRSRSYKFDNFLQQTILITDNSYNNKQILVMEKTILGNLEWQYVFLVRFITASMSDPKRERMSKKKSSQVHCISSHDHILMMASTSKHIPEIRLYKAWKGNNIIIYSLPEANNITCFLLFKYDYMIMLLLHQRFFCGGRLIFGPDVNSLFLTSFLIGAPALTFYIRMLVWIQKDDPIFNYTVTSAFILTLLVFTFLFLTSARDPGIIPRNKTSVNLEDSSNSSLTQSMEILISRFLEQKTFSLTATLSKSSSVRLVCSTVHHVHQTAPYVTTVSNALITIVRGLDMGLINPNKTNIS